MRTNSRAKRAGFLFTSNRPVHLIAVFMMLAALLMPLSARAESQSGESDQISISQLLQPLSGRVSAASWAMMNGYDPRVGSLGEGRAADIGWGQAAVGGTSGGATASSNQQAPFRSPSPAFSRNLLVTQQLGLFPIQTEPQLAVDPSDPEHLVLGVIDYNFPSMSTYVSFDGGENWQGPNQVRYFRNDFQAAGDPVLTIDDVGTVYMTSISMGFQDFRLGQISSAGEVSSMVISRSYDGGITWTDPVSTARSTITTVSNTQLDGKERGTVTIGFLDKPWIASGPNPNDPSSYSVYMTYTDFETTYGIEYIGEVPTFTAPFAQSTIRMVRSDDGGVTWTEPVDISPTFLSGEVEGGEEGEGGLGRATEEVLKPAGSVSEGKIDTSESKYGEDGRQIPSAYTVEGVANLLWPNATPLTEQEINQAKDFLGEVKGDTDVDADSSEVKPGADGASTSSQPDSGAGGNVTENQQEALQEEQEQQTENVLEADRTVQGSQPEVMPDGTLVIAYLDSTNDGVQKGLATIQIVVSKDGGETLSNPVQAGLFRELHQTPRNAFFRYWGANFPQLAVGPNNDIYVTVTALPDDKPTDDGDIMLMRSTNGGATWETPERINQDQTDHLQFFPSMDVSPNGTLHLMWGDMRDDPEEARYNIYYTKSEDQGASFGFKIKGQDFVAPDTVVSDFKSNSLKGFPQGLFLGDYFSLQGTDDDVYMVWADTRLGEYNGPNQQVAFARQKAITAPSLFLSPPSGAAGRTVDVQGFGFQPKANIVLQIGGLTVSNLLTDDQGQFTATIAMPISGEGATEYRAYDDTGNQATASFFTDFGFDSVQASLNQIGAQLGVSVATPVAAGANDSMAPPVVSQARTSSNRIVWYGLGALVAAMVAGGVGFLIGHRRT
jgi:hypothetical protein